MTFRLKIIPSKTYKALTAGERALEVRVVEKYAADKRNDARTAERHATEAGDRLVKAVARVSAAVESGAIQTSLRLMIAQRDTERNALDRAAMDAENARLEMQKAQDILEMYYTYDQELDTTASEE